VEDASRFRIDDPDIDVLENQEYIREVDAEGVVPVEIEEEEEGDGGAVVEEGAAASAVVVSIDSDSDSPKDEAERRLFSDSD